MRNRCNIALETLLDYREGRLDAEATTRTQAHVAGCAHCAERLPQIERLFATLQEAERYHAPQSAIEKAQALYRERFRAPERTSLLARLRFDGRANFAFAGARGEAGTSYRMVYSVEGYDLELWHEREENGQWAILGQALRAEGEAVTPEAVMLLAENGTRREAVQDSGEFHLEAIPQGVYRLEIALPDAQIVVAELPIGMGA